MIKAFDKAWGYFADEGKGQILQEKLECEQVFDLMQDKECKSLLEIGTRNGGNIFVLAHALPKGSMVVALDRGERITDIHNTVKALCRLEVHGYNTHYVYGDSTFKEAERFANKWGPYDMVFIDGDHRWDGVHNDWQKYGMLAKKLVAFHDIVEVGCPSPHIVDYWEMMKEKWGGENLWEFKAPRTDKGIGVLDVGMMSVGSK